MKKLVYTICSGLLCLATAQAQILIDFSDGVADGDHDVEILAGSFDTQTTAAPSPWQAIGPGIEQFAASLASSVGSANNYVVDWDAGQNARSLAVDTGYTIVGGETYNMGFMWRDAWAWTTAETVNLTLYYTDDNTITGVATDIVTLNSGPETVDSTWETETATGLSGAGGVGKTLFVRIDQSTTRSGLASNYARFDNVFLEIASIVEKPIYSASVATTGGEFNASYPASNLINNGFTSSSDAIDTTGDYIAAGNNYASQSGTTNGFTLIFEFSEPHDLDGMYVWNYVYRNGGGGATSPDSGVDSCELTFVDGPGGTGTQIGGTIATNLAPAQWNALNTAESISFGTTYTEVKSVVMQVLSNHGSTLFTGMNELMFNGETTPGWSPITSFTSSDPFVQMPAMVTLDWEITGEITSLEVTPDVGDVLPLTTAGQGSVQVSPLGHTSYTLTLNGTEQRSLELVGLPSREKVHLYLLIGQSNMEGHGRARDTILDAPDSRVLQFGSRDGMESTWLLADHDLTSLSGNSGSTGMGIEFGKTLLTSRNDPELVIGLVNHALGATAIQWWAPGASAGYSNPTTGQPYKLYDEAIERITAASTYGTIKGVLWHQGEYNANQNSNPSSEPDLYAGRLQALVDNLRTDLGIPGLPLVCGKFVPAVSTNALGQPFTYTGLPDRMPVEAALADLPNQRSNTFCVDNAGLRGIENEKIHFDSWSQRQLGQRYAAAITNYHSDPFTFYLGGFYDPAALSDPLIVSPDGDNDSDGISNYREYAFGTDPSQADATAPYAFHAQSVAELGEFPTFSFRRRFDTEAPDYVVDMSSDLVNWQSNVEGQPEIIIEVNPPVDNGDGSWTVTVRYALPFESAGPNNFFRLKMTSP